MLERLNELYKTFVCCMNTRHGYALEGGAGFAGMQSIMQAFRSGIAEFSGKRVVKLLDYAPGHHGLPKSDVLGFRLEDRCSIVLRPSGTETRIRIYVSVSAENREAAERIGAGIVRCAGSGCADAAYTGDGHGGFCHSRVAAGCKYIREDVE